MELLVGEVDFSVENGLISNHIYSQIPKKNTLFWCTITEYTGVPESWNSQGHMANRIYKEAK